MKVNDKFEEFFGFVPEDPGREEVKVVFKAEKTSAKDGVVIEDGVASIIKDGWEFRIDARDLFQTLQNWGLLKLFFRSMGLNIDELKDLAALAVTGDPFIAGDIAARLPDDHLAILKRGPDWFPIKEKKEVKNE